MSKYNKFKEIFGTLKINRESKLPFWDNFLATKSEDKKDLDEYLMVSYETFLRFAYKFYKKDKRDISFEDYIEEEFPKKITPKGY